MSNESKDHDWRLTPADGFDPYELMMSCCRTLVEEDLICAQCIERVTRVLDVVKDRAGVDSPSMHDLCRLFMVGITSNQHGLVTEVTEEEEAMESLDSEDVIVN